MNTFSLSNGALGVVNLMYKLENTLGLRYSY
jgi:hypothetical protein